MKKSCPKGTRQQCVWWEITTISMLVFVAVYAIISHTTESTAIKEFIISIGTSCCVLWSIWVIRTFRNIMTWWVDIQHKVDSACNLLSETKQEIKELKLLKQGK